MAAAKDKVDTVIKNSLHPHLRQAGYRKRGRTYHLSSDGVSQIVSVSRSVRNLPGMGTIGHFGVELGLYFSDVYRIGQGHAAKNPSIHECYVYRGLPADGWGAFDEIAQDQPSIEQQATALERAWLNHGEKWFAAHRDPSAACQWAIRREEWKEALYFSIFLRDWRLARELLAKCRSSYGGEWAAYIEEIARKHGVSGSQGA